MIFIMKPDGVIMPSISSPVYQGADGTNIIYLFAPSMVGNVATVAFRTPDGVWTEREHMTQVAVLPEEFSKYNYCVWQYTIDAPIARLDGVVTVQFFFYSNGSILPSSASSFVVGRGVPVILPNEPSANIYDKILQAIAEIQKSQQYGDYAARAIFEWRKERVDGAAITYGKGEFTYVPAGADGGPIGKTGSFVKSLVDDNTQPPYVNGELNNEYWESVVNFDYLNDFYFASLKALVKDAEGYKDAAETAQRGALTAKEEAQEAQRGALTAKDEAQKAQTQTEHFKEEAGKYATQAGDGAQASARSAAEALASATSAQEAAQRAEEFARYGIRINTTYSSLEELPRPGNSQLIYLIPNGSSAPNAFDEYVWTEKGGGEYEKIGTTEIDLSAYLTKTDAEQKYLTQTAAGQTYLSKTDAESDYLKNTDAEDTYLAKTDAEQKYLTQTTAEDTYLAKTDAERDYLKKSGGNMGGPLGLANNTWNSVGDDAQFGDNNVAGCFCIMGKNGESGVALIPQSGKNPEKTQPSKIQYDGDDIIITIPYERGIRHQRVIINGETVITKGYVSTWLYNSGSQTTTGEKEFGVELSNYDEIQLWFQRIDTNDVWQGVVVPNALFTYLTVGSSADNRRQLGWVGFQFGDTESRLNLYFTGHGVNITEIVGTVGGMKALGVIYAK